MSVERIAQMPNALEGYESVAERLEKFWNLYPSGRVSVEIVYQDGQRYIVKSDLYRDIDDLIPFATDYAEEIRSNANKFPLENASTSAIGRSMHSGGLSKFSDGIARPSFEEMRRVNLSVVPTAEVGMTVTEVRDPWSFGAAIDSTVNQVIAGEAPSEAPLCAHGHRIWKEGESARGKYAGWVCSEKNKANQCKAEWLKLSADGRWV
jgi:hypothetical protein